MRELKELQEFRDLMTRPGKYEDGFGWGSVIMAFFVGILMAPAQMYMQLVAGIAFGFMYWCARARQEPDDELWSSDQVLADR